MGMNIKIHCGDYEATCHFGVNDSTPSDIVWHVNNRLAQSTNIPDNVLQAVVNKITELFNKAIAASEPLTNMNYEEYLSESGTCSATANISNWYKHNK